MEKNIVTDEMISAAQEASGHSVYGGSSIPRIVGCPASVGMELRSPLQPESKYAAAGTRLHGYSEKAMTYDDPIDWIMSNPDLDIVDMDLLADSAEYVQDVIDLHPDGSYDIKLEKLGNLADYGLPEVYGTMDVVIQSRYRTDVIDYKYGYGVGVTAEKNLQLVTYLGMAMPYIEEPDNDHSMFVHICQPTKSMFSHWEVDYQKLYQYVLGDITDAIAESRSPNPRFGPSESNCRFCRANMRCKARIAWLKEQAALIHHINKNPSEVSNHEWSQFLDGFNAVKSAAAQIQKYAESEIIQGNDFPGYKLIQGKANRAFRDKELGQEYIKRVLGNKAYATKERPLVTLAQAEKIHPKLKKDEAWKQMIHKPEGSIKLVKAEHKGEAMVFGTASLMDDLAKGRV